MRVDSVKRQALYSGLALVIAALLMLPMTGAAATPPAGYILGPGDVLEISVWGYPDLTRQGAVGPDATIALPLIGSVSTAGMSVERLTELITQAYAQYIVDPHVMVTIKEYRKLRVSVLGQVARPGGYDLPLGTRLLDLIAAGGGPTDVASLKEAQLHRPGQRSVVVDLTRAMAGDAAVNVPLQGGETLIIPEDLVSFVNVQGEVVKPGRYRLKGELRVIDVLSMAGGLTARASVTQASITRANGVTQASATPASTKTEALGLDGLLLRQEMDRNVVVQAGDLLFVPEETNDKIYVIGDVKHPGVFPVKGDLTLLQAIALAGGPEQRGAGTAKVAYVVRRNGNLQEHLQAGPAKVTALPDGRALVTADLAAIMQDPGRDVPVQPGDVLVLPQTQLGGLQVIVNILAGIAQMFHPFR